MFLRRTAAASAAVVLGLGLAACGSSGGDENTLVISASSTPHVEILEQVVSTGALGDYSLDIREVTGEIDPNELLAAGDVDANFFQHEPYLVDWQKQNGVDNLVAVADVHLEPISLYSNKVTSLDEIADGDSIAVPRDTTNYARALYLLESAGLITMDVPFTEADLSVVTEANITENPKNLEFIQIERPQLARQLDDPQVTAAVINSNYALEAGLTPADDPSSPKKSRATRSPTSSWCARRTRMIRSWSRSPRRSSPPRLPHGSRRPTRALWFRCTR